METDKYGRIRLAANDADEPIFVFGAGERCGSTLIQRLLISHPDVFIWGEQGGAIEHLAEFMSVYAEHNNQFAYVRNLFSQFWENEFIANLSPGMKSLRHGMASAVRMTYGGYATRWGIKEIRCGSKSIKMLKWLFPQSKFVLIVRDVNACVSSVLRWEYSYEQCETVINNWTRLVLEFSATSQELTEDCLLVRYEDFIASPLTSIHRMTSFVGLDEIGLDYGVLKVRVADHSSSEEIDSPKPRAAIPIPSPLLALLDSSEVASARRICRYL